MDKYYYLVAQLPFLEFGKESYISRQEFLEEAKRWLNEKEFSLLSQADINNLSLEEGYPEVLREYIEFERELRQKLASLRKALKKGQDYSLPEILKSLGKEDTPLEIEKYLLQLRWRFIEEKEVGHYFDLSFLILYFLKIQILERLFTFNKEKGKVKFNLLCKVNLLG